MIQELDVQKIRKDFPMLQNQNLIYLTVLPLPRNHTV